MQCYVSKALVELFTHCYTESVAYYLRLQEDVYSICLNSAHLCITFTCTIIQDGRTALMRAAAYIEAIPSLSRGRPFSESIKNVSCSMVETLIDAKANLEAKDKVSLDTIETPYYFILHYVISN